jgi:hypothetical protein
MFRPTEAETIKIYKKMLAARRIWRMWFRANTNPVYKVCQCRLLRDFEGLPAVAAA